MDSRIQILSEDLINKIAAGEVIERPASVVKELVENSIDAKASKITVEVQAAGRKLIRVSDNGSGMTKEEIKLSIQRHSTSKLKTLDDLFNIQTLGFRGEALPSIASVSKFELEPNPSGSGVTAKVKDLFYNTPARKKFMKSPITEMGHIGNIVSKYALANPQIAFELISDGKPLLHTAGTGNLRDAIVSVYGLDLFKELTLGEAEFSFGKISGFISKPTLSRVDKTYEVFFVNNRYIRNFLLNRALEEAYRTLIPNNRYPVAILFVEIDPKKIDVNVHPAKREVKFQKTNEVMEAIRQFVAKTLKPGKDFQVRDLPCRQAGWQPDQNIGQATEILFNATLEASENPFFEDESSSEAQLLPVYQFKNTYIVATDREELVLIDQHAAHERIIYDQLCKNTKAEQKQTLLIPETVEAGPMLKGNLEYLNSIGFDLEEFGSNTYRLRSVPSVAIKTSPKQLLLDIVEELKGLGKSVQLDIKKENIRKLIACKSAVKAGDKLSYEEMTQLIKDLFSTENPLTCPHGRPTMIKISEPELAKRFKRTGF